jgi:conjugal transfer mating pair stabilization protein TraN
MKIRVLVFMVLIFIFKDVTANITCSELKEECVEAGETRPVGPNRDIQLYLPCWRYEKTYECKAASDNNCKQLAADGCSPKTAICRTAWAGVCAVQDVVYDCPTRRCDGRKIVCNDGKGFCLDGSCMSQKRSEDGDMHKALAALSALAAASDAYTKDLVIFKGEPADCSTNTANFKSCCDIHPSGWGEGVFAECTEQEKVLARKKNEGLAAEIGEFCYNEVLGKCTSVHTVYCVFDSKLGRIVRVAANRQLGLNFGTPESPNCRGLTLEELQRINFREIDFSEFYKDIDQKKKVQLADQINPVLRQKLEGLKAKLHTKTQNNIKRADDLRIR